MKTKKIVLGLGIGLVLISLFFFAKKSPTNTSSNWRDAVASQEALEQAQEAIPNKQIDEKQIPVPEAKKEETGTTSKKADKILPKVKALFSVEEKITKKAVIKSNDYKEMTSQHKKKAIMDFKKNLKADEIEGSTLYEVLKNVFAKASPATEKDLIGWYAGRAVYSTAPNTYIAALLIGQKVTINSTGGPLLAKEKIKVDALVTEDEPDYFDIMTPEKIKEAKELTSSNKWSIILSPSLEGKVTNTLKGKDSCICRCFATPFGVPACFKDCNPTYYQLTMKVTYRKYRDFIVEHNEQYFDGKFGGDIYSYYFLDVTPKEEENTSK